MNKIFKIKRNSLGQSIVTSELAKSRSKTSSLATVLVTSLLSIGTSIATPSTVGQGNLVTGEKGVTDGYNNTVTAIKGTAQGNDSIATGNNLSRDEFSAKLNEHNTLLSDKTSKEGEIDTVVTNIEVNNQAQANLNNQIQDLNKIIDRATEKSSQLDNLNNQLTGKQNELTSLIEVLNKAKQNAASPSSTGTGDKTIWTNFTAQLGKLNWNKLSDSSGGTSGVNKLATDLKGMIEADYPDYTDRWELKKYENIINGYINQQGLYDVNKSLFDDTLKKEKENVAEIYSLDINFKNSMTTENDNETSKFLRLLQDTLEVTNKSNLISLLQQTGTVFNLVKENPDLSFKKYLSYDEYHIGYDFEYNKDEFKGFKDYLKEEGIFNGDDLVSYKDSRGYNNVMVDLNNYNNKIIKKFGNLSPKEDYNNKLWNKYLSILTINNLSDDSIFKKNSASYWLGKEDSSYRGGYIRNDSNSRESNTSSFLLPPLKDGVKSRFKYDIFGINGWKTYKEEIDKIFTSGYLVREIDVNNVLKPASDSLNLLFEEQIDWEADQSKWIINKNDYIAQSKTVREWNNKIRDYVTSYNEMIKNPNDNALKAKVLSLFQYITDHKSDPKNYYESIKPTVTDEFLNEWNIAAEKAKKQMQDFADKLKLYDPRNEIVKGVITAAQELEKDIDNAKKAVDEKQNEIDEINKQITDLALTPDEQGAADLKHQKEQELANKQAEKTQLEQDKSAKEAELDKINRKLSETGLANLGKNSMAFGTNAFASGNDSIAIGTQSTVTKADGIALGQNTTVTGEKSIAIGKDSTVSGEKSIAIGVGHNVSGNHSSTIGDPNTITGNNVFVAGNNNNVASNNVMVMGNNVTVGTGFDNAVVLGANSAVAAANAVTSMEIGGKTYNFAGTAPSSVVSVGAADQERQIVNVAAGRVTATSTDAINGSQLYALAEAVKNNKVSPKDVSDEVTNQLEAKLVAGDNISIDKDDATNTFTIAGKNTQSVVKAGNGVAVAEADNAQGTKDYTVSVSDTLIKAGNNVEITGDAQNGFTINTKPATTIKAGEGVNVSGDSTNGYTITNNVQDTNTQSVTKAGQGITVTETDNDQGTKNYTIAVKTSDGLTTDENGNVKVNDNLVKAGNNIEVSGNAKDGFTVNAKGTQLTAGNNIKLSGDAVNGYTITAVTTAIEVTKDQFDDLVNKVGKIVDTNTQSVTKAGEGVTVTETDNAKGTKDYTVSVNTGAGLKLDNGKVTIKDDLIKAGNGVTVSGNPENGFTISSVDTNTQSVTKSGQGINVTETDNAQGTKDYTVALKTGDGLAFDKDGKVKVKDDLVKAGENVNVTGNTKDGYTMSVDNMRSIVEGGQGTSVTVKENADGSKNYTVKVKVGDGLAYDENGNVVNNLKLTAGNNVQVTGNAKTGYTVSATDANTQSTVTSGQGITVKATDNAIGTKDYNVEAKLGKGLKIDENGAITTTAQPINGGNGVAITTNNQDESVVNVVGVTTATDDGKSYTRTDLTKLVGVKGDNKNIRTTTATNGDIQVRMSDNIQVNSVTVNNGPIINQNGIDANNTRVINVQDGVAPTDAVNVRQLNQQGSQINNRIDNLANAIDKNKKRTNAGIASTAAMANIPQVMLAGKSGLGVGVGHRIGQSAIAVGYSRASDNAKHIIKLSVGVDTQSKTTVGAGYMYQW